MDSLFIAILMIGVAAGLYFLSRSAGDDDDAERERPIRRIRRKRGKKVRTRDQDDDDDGGANVYGTTSLEAVPLFERMDNLRGGPDQR